VPFFIFFATGAGLFVYFLLAALGFYFAAGLSAFFGGFAGFFDGDALSVFFDLGYERGFSTLAGDALDYFLAFLASFFSFFSLSSLTSFYNFARGDNLAPFFGGVSAGFYWGVILGLCFAMGFFLGLNSSLAVNLNLPPSVFMSLPSLLSLPTNFLMRIRNWSLRASGNLACIYFQISWYVTPCSFNLRDLLNSSLNSWATICPYVSLRSLSRGASVVPALVFADAALLAPFGDLSLLDGVLDFLDLVSGLFDILVLIAPKII